MTGDIERRFMIRALQLAKKGLYTTDPNPRVGCVIVKDGDVVGEGWHARAGGPHAEVHALAQAGTQARGATVYLTLEPCSHYGRTPPCADALVQAGVARVIVAARDPNPLVAGQGLAKLSQAGIVVHTGLLEEQAVSLNPGFHQRMRVGRPWVRCKVAMSLDGRTAMASGESQWITTEAARADVHRWRARSSAIMTGIGTVLADNPSLTARNSDGLEVLQPVRVVLDTTLKLPSDAQLLSLPGTTLVYTASEDLQRRASLQSAQVEVVTARRQTGGLDLQGVLTDLAARGINEVLVEAGATLSGALLEQGLVDELILYLAPSLLGHQARAAFNLPAIQTLAQKLSLKITDTRAIGQDWRIIAQPKVN